jgi:phospholipase C
MDYKQNTSIVVLGALAAIVLTIVGSPHVTLAATTATSHFRHSVTTTPGHFRPFINSNVIVSATTPGHFRPFINSTANATATTTTTTPIKHIIVIFQENNSFDHYFGTFDHYFGNPDAVSYLKAATYEQGHPKSSDPLAEQTFLVNTITAIQKLPQWNNTAIILTWDDSGGWYDHVMPPIVSPSDDPTYDRLYGEDPKKHTLDHNLQ